MRTKVVIFASLLLLVAVSASDVSAVQTEPLTVAEELRVLQFIIQLERDPLGASAPEIREALLAWIIEAEEFELIVCGDTSDLFRDLNNFVPELFGQTIFGAAAFVVKHPEKAGDDFAKQLAGIESMLRAYESILASAPTARGESLDNLLSMRQDGSLESWVEKMTQRCLSEIDAKKSMPESDG